MRVRGLMLIFFLFTWMFLECTHILACPPNLWQCQLPGFSTLGGLSPWIHPGLLLPISLQGIGRAELKPTTFSALLQSYFSIIFFLSIFLTPSVMVPLSAACCGFSLLIIIYILLLRSNPSRQHWGLKRKDRKRWRNRSKEKVVGFSSFHSQI